MKKLAAVIIWVIALALLLHATRGIVWGYEYPSNAVVATAQVGAGSVVMVASNSSGLYLYSLSVAQNSNASFSLMCGSRKVQQLGLGTPANGHYPIQTNCTASEQLIASASGAGVVRVNVQYSVGTPTPQSLGAISVDTDDLEDRVKETFILQSWFDAFIIFCLIFFAVIFYFRRR